ncbi:hypothetical protein, partial [Roseovarius gaetbuli]|uniref:hypothetical protein n=1 Tax=Roseovarius gaetbuli TaxID=1356575 RepID=UPI001BAF3F3C
MSLLAIALFPDFIENERRFEALRTSILRKRAFVDFSLIPNSKRCVFVERVDGLLQLSVLEKSNIATSGSGKINDQHLVGEI